MIALFWIIDILWIILFFVIGGLIYYDLTHNENFSTIIEDFSTLTKVTLSISLIYVASFIFVDYGHHAISFGSKHSRDSYSHSTLFERRVLVAFNSQTMRAEPRAIAYLWEEKLDAPTEIETTLSVQPITDNPKVRKLTYTVHFSIDPGYYFDEYGTLKSNDKIWQIAKEIEYWLYEFNNQKSKQLAKFHNPHNPKERKELSEMMMNYLYKDNRLDSRIRMKGLVSFDVI